MDTMLSQTTWFLSFDGKSSEIYLKNLIPLIWILSADSENLGKILTVRDTCIMEAIALAPGSSHT